MIHQIRLELARCHDFPEGSSSHGYEFIMPLTATGQLDHEAWLKGRHHLGFRRFWGDAEEEKGELRHGRHGWTLTFEPGTEEDEVIFKGDDHRFLEGEYVSIKERDGVMRTFRIASVR